jgi:hypothetical protein
MGFHFTDFVEHNWSVPAINVVMPEWPYPIPFAPHAIE